MRQLMSISMDGPNVKFKLVELLQKEHAELYGGAQLSWSWLEAVVFTPSTTQ